MPDSHWVCLTAGSGGDDHWRDEMVRVIRSKPIVATAEQLLAGESARLTFTLMPQALLNHKQSSRIAASAMKRSVTVRTTWALGISGSAGR